MIVFGEVFVTSRVTFHWVSATKWVENVFLTHDGGLGISLMTLMWAVVLVAYVRFYRPSLPPLDFSLYSRKLSDFSMLYSYWFYNKVRV